MKRALFYVFCAAMAVVAARHVTVGHATLWQRAQNMWHSPLYQKGVKGLGDRVLDHLRPGEGRHDGKAGDGCSRPKAQLEHMGERGPDDERDLPPAPIPPPKEPLLHRSHNDYA